MAPRRQLSLRVLRLQRRQFRYQTQGNGQAFQLVVWTQEELRGVVARVVFNFLHLHFRRRQRFTGLGFLGGVSRVAVHVVHHPVVQPAFHLFSLAEGADFVAHDALQVVSKTTAGEQVRQTGGQTRVSGGIRVVILGRFLQGLRADEGGEV